MLTFKSFLEKNKLVERPEYIVLTPKKTGHVLGIVDTDSPNYSAVVSRVQNVTVEDYISEQVDRWLEERNLNIPTIKSQLLLWIQRYFSATAEMMAEFFDMVINSPVNIPYKKEAIIELSSIFDPYKKYFNEAFFTKLLDYKPAIPGQTNIGRGEIALALLTQLKKSPHAGDLVDGNNVIELKGYHGAFCGAWQEKIGGVIAKRNVIEYIIEWVREIEQNNSKSKDPKFNAEIIYNMLEDLNKRKEFGKQDLTLLHELLNTTDLLKNNSAFLEGLLENMANIRGISITNAMLTEFKKVLNGRPIDMQPFVLAFHFTLYKTIEAFSYIFFFTRDNSKFIPYSASKSFAADIAFFRKYATVGTWGMRGAFRVMVKF